MSNVIRGGQNLLHYFRMFDQVARSLFWVFVTTTLVIMSYLCYLKITLYNLKVYFIYLIAKAYVAMNINNIKISIVNLAGLTQKHKTLDIVNNNQVIKIYHFINEQLLINLFYGLKWAIIITIATISCFGLKGWKMSKKKTLRGKQLVKTGMLRRQIFFYNLRRFCFKPVTIASIPFPHNAEKTHTLITGASGTGKTVIMSDLIDQVRRKHHKAIIYDKMGVYVERFFDPTKDILLNPLDARSVNWNLLAECTDLSAFDTIAKAFIPATKTSDPFWENAARIVFSESLSYLKKAGKTNNQDLQEIYFGSNQIEFNSVIQSSGILNKILSKDNERTTGSILSVMISYVRCLKFLNNDTSNSSSVLNQTFNIRKWIEDEEQQGFLIISSNANQHETLKPLISVFLELAINNLLALKPNPKRNIWLFLDELPSLHYLPSLQSGLSESRQFGGSFVLSMQLMAQIRSIYGRDLAESVSGLCRNRVVFSTPDEETANWCSGSLGRVEIQEIKENFSYGASQMRDGVSLNKVEQVKPLVLPAEIMNQKDLSCYLSLSGFPLTQSQLKYHHYPVIIDRLVPKYSEENLEENLLKQNLSAEYLPKNQKNLEEESLEEIIEESDLEPELESEITDVDSTTKPPLINIKNNFF